MWWVSCVSIVQTDTHIGLQTAERHADADERLRADTHYPCSRAVYRYCVSYGSVYQPLLPRLSSAWIITLSTRLHSSNCVQRSPMGPYCVIGNRPMHRTVSRSISRCAPAYWTLFLQLISSTLTTILLCIQLCYSVELFVIFLYYWAVWAAREYSWSSVRTSHS